MLQLYFHITTKKLRWNTCFEGTFTMVMKIMVHDITKHLSLCFYWKFNVRCAIILTPASLISSSELKKLYTILREYMETECSGIANWNCYTCFILIFIDKIDQISIGKKRQNSSQHTLFGCSLKYMINVAIGLLSAVLSCCCFITIWCIVEVTTSYTQPVVSGLLSPL